MRSVVCPGLTSLPYLEMNQRVAATNTPLVCGMLR